MAWDGNPEQLIRDEALWRLRKGTTLTFNHPMGHQCQMVNDRLCFTGAIFKDGDLIYRIGEYDPETNCWHARWPD